MEENHDSTKVEAINALSRARDAVKNLLKYRDDYLLKVAEKYSLLSDNADIFNNTTAVIKVIKEIDGLISNRPRAIRRLSEDTIATLQDMEHIFSRASPIDKAEFCYLNGKALNTVQPDTCGSTATDGEVTELAIQASQWLTRALKFNPQNADAWVELGECCWRQGDPLEAENHFRQALKIDPEHVEALCQLSMVLRQLPSITTDQSRSENQRTFSTGIATVSKSTTTTSQTQVTATNVLSESLQLAHQAVRHKPTNGYVWSILGNALLTVFFESWGSVAVPYSKIRPRSSASSKHSGLAEENDSDTPNTQLTSSQLIMTRCIAAYAQAAKDRTVALEPNFHYNRGIAWHFQDSFANALCSWLRAICLDPQWLAPRTCVTRLVEFLLELNRSVDQIRNEVADHAESCSPQQSRVTGIKTPHLHRDSHMHVADLIGPLAPCLILAKCAANEGGSGKTTSASVNSAISRLLGPYFAGGDVTRTLLCGTQSSSRKKLARASGKRANTCVSPFQNTSNWQLTFFDNLQIGSNKERVCVGRVLKELPSDTDLALNLLLVDAHGTPLAVRLYNIGKGLGPLRKDILAIPHPFIEEREVPCALIHSAIAGARHACASTNAHLNETRLNQLLTQMRLPSDEMGADSNFSDVPASRLDEANMSTSLRVRILRVPLPDVLVVNGQPVGSSWTAAPVLKNIFFTAS